ncbi:MAG: VCBS repeat-containing protein, partial [Bacteroidota bacterium]
MRVYTILLCAIFSTWGLYGQTFTKVSVPSGTSHAVSGAKDGGFAWGDINQDGFQDLVVLREVSGESIKILWSDADPVAPAFTDVTASKCARCFDGSIPEERTALLADVNHDGYLDLFANGNYSVRMFMNSGPPNYDFDSLAMHLTSIPDGMNVEGMMLLDMDEDGWLDLLFDNHTHGMELFLNPADGSMNFVHQDPTSFGLPENCGEGDYATAADLNKDGYIDAIFRKDDCADIAINNNGKFNFTQDIADALNGNKGGVSVADFDNDGDLDMYWTDAGINQIWLNDGNGYFVPTANDSDGEPWRSAGISAPSSGIDGIAVGDVNHDGNIDIFLSTSSSSQSGYLFLNQTRPGEPLSFVHDNLGIDLDDNGEGASFVDYDNDGDLDLYVNVRYGDNQLWRNDFVGEASVDYLKIEPRLVTTSGWRAAIGANVQIEDLQGNVVSGLKDVPSGTGHGTDAPDILHFGLPYGRDHVYRVSVWYPRQGAAPKSFCIDILPSHIENQHLIVYDTTSSRAPFWDYDKDGVANRDDIDDDNDAIPDEIERNVGLALSDYGNNESLISGSSTIFERNQTEPVMWIGNGVGSRSYKWMNQTYVDPQIPDDRADGVQIAITKANTIINQNIVFDFGGVVTDISFDLGGIGDGIENIEIKALNWQYDTIESAYISLSEIGDSLTQIASNRLLGQATETAWDAEDFSARVKILKDARKVIIHGIHQSGELNFSVSNVSYGHSTDYDNDGIPDDRDLDAENDGILDVYEVGGTFQLTHTVADANGNGLLSRFENAAAATSIFFDLDGNGTYETVPDADGDNVPNYQDPDADNDGIPDLVESGYQGITSIDINLDGVVDGDDDDSDGLMNVIDTLDGFGGQIQIPLFSDEDNLADFMDLDSDNDGVKDLEEAHVDRFIIDANADGIVDGDDDDADGIMKQVDLSIDFGGIRLTPINTDGDFVPDFRDLDSDNDGIGDLWESGLDVDRVDRNLDGIVDGDDDDADGVMNIVDPIIGPGGSGPRPADKDADNIANLRDLDSDNDGISDLIEGGLNPFEADLNRDGVVDGDDDDSDGLMNIIDDNEGPGGLVIRVPDTDQDGVRDFLDIDSDNDGVKDGWEDTNGTGWSDQDGDGIPNFRDEDADGDGLPDKDEAWDWAGDNDSASDLNCDSTDNDNDGLLACYDADDSDSLNVDYLMDPPADNGYQGVGDYDGDSLATGSTPGSYFPNNGGDPALPDFLDNPFIDSTPHLGDFVYAVTDSGLTSGHYSGGRQTFRVFASEFTVDPEGWAHYYHPREPEKLIFSIHHRDNVTPIDYVEINWKNYLPEVSNGSEHQGMFTLNRDWNVKTWENQDLVDSLGNPATVDVRFYFPMLEYYSLESRVFLFALFNGDAEKGEAVWFKTTHGSGAFDEGNMTMNSLGDIIILDAQPFAKTTNDKNYVEFRDVAGFSGGTLAIPAVESNPLPVEWGDMFIEESEQGVMVNWETLTEDYTDHFVIERSVDGLMFAPLGEMPASGQSQAVRGYQFLDQTARQTGLDRLYYRIIMYDWNGESAMSPTLQLHLNTEAG